MTIPDPTYITVDELKTNTLLTGITSLSNADITKLIQIAEDQIDKFVGRQPHHPCDSNFDRVFPREQDYYRASGAGYVDEDADVPVIPYNVSRAAQRQVEWLYKEWWPNRATETLPDNQPLQAQEIGGDGSIREVFARGGLSLNEASLCDEAKQLLDGFRKRGCAIATSRV